MPSSRRSPTSLPSVRMTSDRRRIPLRGRLFYSEQVESLARALGVSPGFAADLVKKRSEKAGGGLGLSEIWRVPRANRLSFLETK